MRPRPGTSSRRKRSYVAALTHIAGPLLLLVLALVFLHG